MLNNKDDLWINKYRPTNVKDIIGNEQQIEKFNDWLLNLPKSKVQAVIVSGNQGLGKTLTMRLILEEKGYLVKIINPNEIKDLRLCDDFDDYHNFKNSIYSKIKFSDKKSDKVALIFDETENITLTSEKKYIMNIYKENNKTKSFPLIFISNNQHSKLLNDLKKNSIEIVFNCPSTDNLKKIIKYISLNENICFETEECTDKLIKIAQGDIRRLVNLLQELSYHLLNRKITKEKMSEFIEKSREKNIDIGLFNSTERKKIIVSGFKPKAVFKK